MFWSPRSPAAAGMGRVLCAAAERVHQYHDDGTARPCSLRPEAWMTLVRINKWVNETIKPLTDLEHWGVVEHWSYPDDGYGDCEDYILLKRRMLIQSGWPREVLLVTVVRDKDDKGHAVLTVPPIRVTISSTTRTRPSCSGRRPAIRFVKRQSQSNPNVWVSVVGPQPTTATATSR